MTTTPIELDELAHKVVAEYLAAAPRDSTRLDRIFEQLDEHDHPDLNWHTNSDTARDASNAIAKRTHQLLLDTAKKLRAPK